MMSGKLRAAAKAALETLDCGGRNYSRAAHILRAALAEPEEKLLSIHRLDQWLKAALAEQKPMLEMNPAKREWIGLTDADFEKEKFVDYNFMAGASFAEAKLKDKNGG